MQILKDIAAKLVAGDARKVTALVTQAIEEKIPAQQILNEGLLVGMDEVSRLFQEEELFIPEVLMSARAMSKGSDLLKPLLKEGDAKAVGKACIGTVQGDLHDIGKNLVKMMMEAKGMEVIDLGVDVSAEKFVETAKNEGCQIICCSALLTTTMRVMAEVVEKAKAAGIRDKVKIMVGGAPVTADFCKSIGADVYTNDAASAAQAAVALLA